MESAPPVSEGTLQGQELFWRRAVEDSVYALFGRYFDGRRRVLSATKKAERNVAFLKSLHDIRRGAEASCPADVLPSLKSAFQPLSVYARHESILLSSLYSSSKLAPLNAVPRGAGR